MTDLQKRLRHLLAFYGHPGIDLDQAVADVEGAVKEAGYVKAEAIQTTYGPIKLTPLTKHDALTPEQFMKVGGLDEKIDRIIDDIANKSNSKGLRGMAFNWGIDYLEQIKQAFKDAGWLTPEQRQQTQELVNRMAQTAQDMLKLPVTVRELGVMTGQEWYDRFEKETDNLSFLVRGGDGVVYITQENILNAAKKAAGIE